MISYNTTTWIGDSVLACPTCGAGEVTLKKVKTDFDSPDGNHRLNTTLRFECENGRHDFFYRFSQYKGSTFIEGIEDPK